MSGFNSFLPLWITGKRKLGYPWMLEQIQPEYVVCCAQPHAHMISPLLQLCSRSCGLSLEVIGTTSDYRPNDILRNRGWNNLYCADGETGEFVRGHTTGEKVPGVNPALDSQNWMLPASRLPGTVGVLYWCHCVWTWHVLEGEQSPAWRSPWYPLSQERAQVGDPRLSLHLPMIETKRTWNLGHQAAAF